jgi:GH18 family chitinase
MIGYMGSGGAWNGPAAGTWVSWLNEKSVDKYCQYALSKNLGGVFGFDISMDDM